MVSEQQLMKLGMLTARQPQEALGECLEDSSRSLVLEPATDAALSAHKDRAGTTDEMRYPMRYASAPPRNQRYDPANISPGRGSNVPCKPHFDLD